MYIDGCGSTVGREVGCHTGDGGSNPGGVHIGISFFSFFQSPAATDLDSFSSHQLLKPSIAHHHLTLQPLSHVI